MHGSSSTARALCGCARSTTYSIREKPRPTDESARCTLLFTYVFCECTRSRDTPRIFRCAAAGRPPPTPPMSLAGEPKE